MGTKWCKEQDVEEVLYGEYRHPYPLPALITWWRRQFRLLFRPPFYENAASLAPAINKGNVATRSRTPLPEDTGGMRVRNICLWAATAANQVQIPSSQVLENWEGDEAGQRVVKIKSKVNKLLAFEPFYACFRFPKYFCLCLQKYRGKYLKKKTKYIYSN